MVVVASASWHGSSFDLRDWSGFRERCMEPNTDPVNPQTQCGLIREEHYMEVIQPKAHDILTVIFSVCVCVCESR